MVHNIIIYTYFNALLYEERNSNIKIIEVNIIAKVRENKATVDELKIFTNWKIKIVP